MIVALRSSIARQLASRQPACSRIYSAARSLGGSCLLVSCLHLPASAQTATAEIQETIEMLFEGMRAGDSTMVRSAFLPDAIMSRPVQDEHGNAGIRTRSIDPFVSAVGRPKHDIWDERISGIQIQHDGALATAWMEYAFYLGDTLHHCGVNSMQLVRTDSSWKIATLFDTDRGTDCRVEEDDE